jgi:uncharacterized membrane protein
MQNRRAGVELAEWRAVNREECGKRRAFALFTTRLLIRLEGWQPLPPGTLALWLDALGFLSLAGGGWLGGRLVYGYGVGRS